MTTSASTSPEASSDRMVLLVRAGVGGGAEVDRVAGGGEAGRGRAQGVLGAAESSGTSRPASADASAARMPGPPALPMMPSRRPAGDGLPGQQLDDVEQFLGAADLDHPGLPQQRRDHHVRGRGRGRVGGAAAGAGVGAAGLERDDRLAAGDAAGVPEELLRVAERLQVQRDDLGRRVVSQ
jgi:hypothetical protein